MEHWKCIKWYDFLYQVSDQWNVKSIFYRKWKILSPWKWKAGYLLVILKNEKRKTHQVHRLVAEAFIPNPLNLPCINHIDWNKLNNARNNLEWSSYSDNVKHSHRVIGRNHKFQFECWICWSLHSNIIDAYKCEKRWIPDKENFPVWLMHEFHMHWKFIWIFAIAEAYEWYWDRHLLHTSEWAIRREENCWTSAYWKRQWRDCHTLWDQKCWWGFVRDVQKYKEFHYVTKWWREQPEFTMMTEYLIMKWITPQFYDEDWVLHIGDFSKKHFTSGKISI